MPRWQALRLAGIGSVLCLVLATYTAAQETAEQILEKVDRIRSPQGSFVMQVTITTQNGTQTEQVNGYEVYVQDANQTLVRFTSPKLGAWEIAVDARAGPVGVSPERGQTDPRPPGAAVGGQRGERGHCAPELCR